MKYILRLEVRLGNRTLEIGGENKADSEKEMCSRALLLQFSCFKDLVP